MTDGCAAVDLAVTAVLDHGRWTRLVLRRSVVTLDGGGGVEGDGDGGGPASVEELWVSGPCPSPFDAADLLQDVMRRCGGDLVRGRAVPALPGMESPSTALLVDLGRATEQRTVGVEYLAGYHGTVDDVRGGRHVLRGGDVVATAGFLGVRARQVLVDVLRALALPEAPNAPDPAGAGRPLDRDGVRADLLRDLVDARLRLDQERSWARLAATRLRFVYGAGARAAPGWSRAVRSTPDGAPVGAGDAPRPGRDTLVAVFVCGRGGQVDLFRYRLDARLDLPAVLGDAPVRDAFAVCAAHPTDAVAQARAVAALRGARAVAARDGTPRTGGGTDPGLPVPGQLVPTTATLDGVVVLHDCRGTEVGNEERRFATVAYVFTPARATDELLRGAPEIVEAIVDRSCRVDDAPGRSVRNALAAAVCARP